MTTLSDDLEQLIEENQGLVKSLAAAIHRKLPPYVELDDLIAYGQVGLAEAARDFDPQRGSRFSTYAYYRIRGSVYDGLSKMTWFSRSRYKQIRALRMTDEVLHQEGEEARLSEKTSKEDDVRWLRNVTRALAVVYLAAPGSEEDAGERGALQDHSIPDASAAAMSREMTEKLHELIGGLPPEPQALIRGVYFEGLSLQEAGQKLGISKSWASRLHAKTLQRLARSLRPEGVA
jgi:RNA polymerase sigma factor for flagellar operon FliA